MSDVRHQTPRLIRIVSTDYASLLGLIFPIVGIGLWVATFSASLDRGGADR